MLTLLAARQHSGKELAARFAMSRSALSQHLKLLHEVGLITFRRDGREHHYTLEPRRLCQVWDWVLPLVLHCCGADDDPKEGNPREEPHQGRRYR